MRTFAWLALLLAVAPLALADGPAVESEWYVLGTWNGVVGGSCTGDLGPLSEPAIGGECGLPLHSAVATVAVVDDRQGHVPFHYSGVDAAHVSCGAHGAATSPATLTFPAGCAEVRVFVDAGSLSGTITVSS